MLLSSLAVLLLLNLISFGNMHESYTLEDKQFKKLNLFKRKAIYAATNNGILLFRPPRLLSYLPKVQFLPLNPVQKLQSEAIKFRPNSDFIF
jgi:hypothetical protein